MTQIKEQLPDLAMDNLIYRKLSLRLIPILMLGMFISFMDRANLGVLAGPMSKDLGLTAASFGLAAGLFYLGYLVFEIPSNMAMVKFGARKWIARIMVSWGLVTMLMALIQNEAMLNILRIMLGVAEAGFSPGVYLLLTFWCPPRILGRAYALLHISIPISLAVATALTSTLLFMDGLLGMAGWRWVFLLEGIPAILLGIYIFLALPDRPKNAKWLTTAEKDYLETQVAHQPDQAGHEVRHLPAALKSPAVWVLSFIYFAMTIGFWSITYFLPTIVAERFKTGVIASGFISAIPWVASVLLVLIVARLSAKGGGRHWIMLILLGGAAVGLYMAAATGSPILALIGISLGAAGFNAAIPQFLTMAPQIFVGATIAISIAMINSLGNLSGLVGPWLMGIIKDSTGSVTGGLFIMAGFFVIAAILSFLMSKYAARRFAATQKTDPALATTGN